jgi:putative ABC transporter-associated repeat protein
VKVLLLIMALFAAQPTVITSGHVDLGPRFVNGNWTIQLRDDERWRDLSDVVLQAAEAAALTVPADPAYAFLGPAGSKIWLLPQVQQPGIVWLGWNSQDPSVTARVSKAVTWTLHGVTGPGRFSLFLNGNFGAPEILFDSTKPYPQTSGIEPAAHVHGNWAFSAPGDYLLDIEMSTSTTDGQAVSDRRTLHLFVGQGQPATPAQTATPPAAAPPAVTAPAAGQEAGVTPWLVTGGVLVVGTGFLVWLRRRRAR